jgi:ABC-type transport system involved in multi-copper enzyme maturation permease subunit
VNATLIVTLWRQRLTSPVRMAVVGMLSITPLFGIAFMPGVGLGPLGNAQGLILALGAGLIGQDVSSGVLQLLCARPVRRPEYVVSRWLGVALAGIVVSLLQLGIAAAVLSVRGMAPSAQQVVLFAAGRTIECLGLAAVLTLCSSLIGGVGDLAIYLLGNLGMTILQMVAQVKQWHGLARVAGEIQASLTPTIDLQRQIAATPMPWFPIVSYVSTVTLCLAIAIVVVNRRELSYASS